MGAVLVWECLKADRQTTHPRPNVSLLDWHLAFPLYYNVYLVQHALSPK